MLLTLHSFRKRCESAASQLPRPAATLAMSRFLPACRWTGTPRRSSGQAQDNGGLTITCTQLLLQPCARSDQPSAGRKRNDDPSDVARDGLAEGRLSERHGHEAVDLRACGIFATLHIFLNRATLQD